nr:hypothetical protein [Tanacetum cinerariifolium]
MLGIVDGGIGASPDVVIVAMVEGVIMGAGADLSEMELKKILIEKMEGNKSIQRSDEQRNLYKALVEAYEADKAILDTYRESTILKRRREDDDQEGPSAGPNRGSKRQKEGGEQASASTPSEKATKGAGGSIKGTQSRQQSASESAQAEEPVQTTSQMEETPLPVYETGADEQPIVQTSQHPEWFSQPRKPPSPDRTWNAALPAAQGDAQSWIGELAKQADARSSFNELLDTPIDFSNFIMHRLNVDTLTWAWCSPFLPWAILAHLVSYGLSALILWNDRYFSCILHALKRTPFFSLRSGA